MLKEKKGHAPTVAMSYCNFANNVTFPENATEVLKLCAIAASETARTIAAIAHALDPSTVRHMECMVKIVGDKILPAGE